MLVPPPLRARSPRLSQRLSQPKIRTTHQRVQLSFPDLGAIRAPPIGRGNFVHRERDRIISHYRHLLKRAQRTTNLGDDAGVVCDDCFLWCATRYDCSCTNEDEDDKWEPTNGANHCASRKTVQPHLPLCPRSLLQTSSPAGFPHRGCACWARTASSSSAHARSPTTTPSLNVFVDGRLALSRQP
jgi:hypothetical protein